MAPDADNLDLSITVEGASFHASGTSERVMRALTEFEKLAVSPGLRGDDAETSASPQVSDPDQPTGGGSGVTSTDKVPFGVFMRRDFPNQAARATAIVTWAKRYDAKPALKPRAMETYWKKVAKKPGNPTQVCINAENEGWLDNNGGGSYAVTGHGEATVDDLRPTAADSTRRAG